MRIKKGTSLLARKAGEVKRYRTYKRIIPICMACVAVLTAIVYIVALMYNRFGSFTIRIDKFQELEYGLSLSETKDFAKPTSRLNCKASQAITNIDGKSLDNIDLGSQDGKDNGRNYMCYTFYLKNTGKQIVDYEYSINIVSMTMDIETAVRVRLITSYNGGEKSQVDYARAKNVDDNLEPIPEEGTTPFYTKTMICLLKTEGFKPTDYMKYTVVLWLEGNDEDCIDDIIGGEFKIDMKFSITSVGGVNV